MDIVKESIRRDGIAMARVPVGFDVDVLRYGARDPIGMLQFKATSFPDISSWKLFDSCVVSAFFQLYSRISQANLVNKTFTGKQGPVETMKFNIFNDLLSSLLKGLLKSFSAINVRLNRD
jgi:hypothetical protein